MSLTQEQLELRKQGIGSSDMAAIMGASPYKTAYDVWLEKTGRVADWGGNDATELGNILEPAILAIAARELGEIQPGVRMTCPEAYIASNVDGIVVSTGDPVEAKTAGLLSGFVKTDDWGDPGTDEVPYQYVVQCCVHLIVTGKEVCYVPAIVAGKGFGVWRVYRNDALLDAIKSMSAEFWEKHVKADTPPPDSLPTIETCKRILRVDAPAAQIASSLVDEEREIAEEIKALEARRDEVRSRIIAAMVVPGGRAEMAMSPTGGYSYKEQTRTGLDTKALAEAHPDIAKQFERVSRFPVLRFVKNKSK